jgi:sodium-independent sulfate anion transporter 11
LQYGLYGSFLGCFVYILIGSCKDVPIGPTALASLLTFQAAGGVWQKAVLMSLLTGIIEMLMGLFQLGFIIDFVSGPVGSGFTSAASLIILTSQVKDIFGKRIFQVKGMKQPLRNVINPLLFPYLYLGITAKGGTFMNMWRSILSNIHMARLHDTLMGFTCILVLMVMRVSKTYRKRIAQILIVSIQFLCLVICHY